MKWEDFLAKVSDFTGSDIEELDKDTKIYDDLGMDSLGLFSLGMHLIKAYDVEVPLSAVASIESLEDIYTVLKKEVVKKV